MNALQKGAIGEALVAADISRRGFDAFRPFGDGSPVDMIVFNSSTAKVMRLQIKYRSKDKRTGARKLAATSRKMGAASGAGNPPIDRKLIDGWAVYLEEDNVIKYIPKSFMKGRVSLTIDPEKDYGEKELFALLK